MTGELDHIRAQTDCPVCGRELNVSYRTLRLARTVECPGCGETIRLIDDTPIGKVQRLIDEQDGGDQASRLSFSLEGSCGTTEQVLGEDE